MKSFKSITAVIAGAFIIGACEQATSPVAPPSSVAQVKQANPKPFFSFTKVPVGFADVNITPGPDVTALLFTLGTTGTKSTSITQLAFEMIGNAGPADITNFRVVFFPNGANKPSVVIGTNDGSTWVGPVPGSPPSFLVIDLSTPIQLTTNFKGVFALVLDANATRPFIFQPVLAFATINVGGVVQGLPSSTCDLPLFGDGFHVS